MRRGLWRGRPSQAVPARRQPETRLLAFYSTGVGGRVRQFPPAGQPESRLLAFYLVSMVLCFYLPLACWTLQVIHFQACWTPRVLCDGARCCCSPRGPRRGAAAGRADCSHPPDPGQFRERCATARRSELQLSWRERQCHSLRACTCTRAKARERVAQPAAKAYC